MNTKRAAAKLTALICSFSLALCAAPKTADMTVSAYDAGANASPAQYYSGHTYKVYNEDMTWTQAKAYCEKLGGHLVTIGSEKEQKFVEELIYFEERPNYWIGLTRKASNWHWIDDTALSYKNYGENFVPLYGQEFYGSIFSRSRTYDTWSCVGGEWDSLRDDCTGEPGGHPDITLKTIGFICEWDKKVELKDAVTEQPTFTIMVYLDGADLEPRTGKGTKILKELIKGYNGNPNVKIVVQTGGAKSWRTKTVSADRNQRWLIRKNNKIRLIDDKLGQLNMGEADTLSSFIKYCKKKYPADRYALILSDHGAGMYGVCIDENFGGDKLDQSELRTALKDGGTHFDFIGMDACIMSDIETVLTVADYADLFIGSESLSFTPGWNFQECVSHLCSDTSIKTSTLCKNISDGFIDRMSTRQHATSISVIDTGKAVKNVLPALNELAAELDKELTADKFPQLAYARYNSEIPDANSYTLIDIQQLCELLGDDSRAEALHSAVHDAVVYSNKTTKGLAVRGLSVTLPTVPKYLSKVGETLKFYEQFGHNAAGYVGFVKHYANIVAGSMQYYYGKDAKRLYGNCSWIDSAEFLRTSAEKGMMLTTSKETLPYSEFAGGAYKWLSNADKQYILDCGVELFAKGTGDIKYYSLGSVDKLQEDDMGYKFGTNNCWVTINGTVVPVVYDGKEMYPDGLCSSYYVPCRLSNGTKAHLKLYNVKNVWGSSDWYISGYQTANKKGEYLSSVLPVTGSMSVTLLYDAVDKNGKSTTIKGKDLMIGTNNTIMYSNCGSQLGTDGFYCRLYFIDVFGIYHYTDIAEFDHSGSYLRRAEL